VKPVNTFNARPRRLNKKEKRGEKRKKKEKGKRKKKRKKSPYYDRRDTHIHVPGIAPAAATNNSNRRNTKGPFACTVILLPCNREKRKEEQFY